MNDASLCRAHRPSPYRGCTTSGIERLSIFVPDVVFVGHLSKAVAPRRKGRSIPPAPFATTFPPVPGFLPLLSPPTSRSFKNSPFPFSLAVSGTSSMPISDDESHVHHRRNPALAHVEAPPLHRLLAFVEAELLSINGRATGAARPKREAGHVKEVGARPTHSVPWFA